jgi:hypothetical protein
MKRNLAIAGSVVVLIVIFALVATPLIALQSLRDALVARDSGTLAELVDPAQLRPNMDARTRDYYGSDTSAAAAVTDRLLSPLGLIAAVCDAGLATPPGAAAPFCPISARLGDVRFASLGRFSAALSRPDAVAATVVMDREGLKWRVVDIVLAGSVYDRLRAPLP